MYRLRLLCTLVCFVSWFPANVTGSAPLRFPAPARPVASVVSPAYSSEETRDRRGEAERVMNRLGLQPGIRVADIGAGDGYYTVRVARRLGSAGTIYAVDIKAEYLQRLEARLKREGVSGVTLVHGEPRDPKLPPAAIDVAILSHMYHEVENPYEFLYRLRPALGAGARVAIIDVDKRRQTCDPHPRGLGPPNRLGQDVGGAPRHVLEERRPRTAHPDQVVATVVSRPQHHIDRRIADDVDGLDQELGRQGRGVTVDRERRLVAIA